jgi:hypothetical protein
MWKNSKVCVVSFVLKYRRKFVVCLLVIYRQTNQIAQVLQDTFCLFAIAKNCRFSHTRIGTQELRAQQKRTQILPRQMARMRKHIAQMKTRQQKLLSRLQVFLLIPFY